ncbi:MAG TPA: cyclodeaminase/cyclohydrolase family protein [Caulobacteraceae bacterium]|jgi:formiminotetrahydrofolate cyclodeaminase|nr:cyclodeaminase/cyclohydrolase family protein [Caulobacteraceae bacterium]
MTVISSQSLADFIDAVAADRPAPGAGAAAAVCLALAAGCAAKALRISARHRGGDDALAAAADRVQALARAALDGADRDAADFTALLHAHPGDHDPERALQADGQALLALATEMRRLVHRHQSAVIATLAGDLDAAVALSHAAEQVQRRNLAEMG